MLLPNVLVDLLAGASLVPLDRASRHRPRFILSNIHFPKLHVRVGAGLAALP